MLGRTLSHYRILEKIGAGGMGIVYRARDERLERDVALKVLPAAALANEAARKRFRKEALALSRLNHPNIAAVYDFDTEEGADFLVMEHIQGVTLSQKLAGGLLPEKEVAALGVQIAAALEGAHERGVVHRDLKPGNILVTLKGQAKVLDFGLATLVRPAEQPLRTEALSQEHPVVGTLPYMAPEQLRGEAVDARSDIYAAGSVLFEMATGQRPFPHDNAARLIDAIQHEAPPAPSGFNRRISPALDAIVLKALDKDPKRRYQSAAELRVDLERLGAPPPLRVASRPGTRVISWALAAAGAVLGLVAAIAGLNVGGTRDRLLGRAAPRRIESLAVLPLANMSGDPEQEYFAEGMTEELITDLAKIGALRVISRTSVIHFKGTDKPVPEIARQLGVDAIVEGSVMKSGGRVRITAQLIDGASDRHLWAQSYERDLMDVLSLQGEVARAIAREIEVKLTPQEQARLASARPVNVEAHEAYMKGRYYWNKRDAEGFEKALASFKRAIEIDPGYAPAYAGLADTYHLLATYGLLPPSEAIPKERAAALRALEIDDGLAEAHVSLAPILSSYDYDWAGAEREYRRAIELNPGYATAHQYYSSVLLRLGRNEEAMAEARRARELDPLSLILRMSVAQCYWTSGRVDQSIEEVRKVLEMDPNFYGAHEGLGQIYVEKGMYEEGIGELRRAAALDSGDPTAKADLGYAYGVSGKTEEARRVLADLEAMSKREYVSAINMAVVSIGLGDKQSGLAWLERAAHDRDPLLTWLKIEHRYNPLHAEPRFQDLVRRVGLPPD
jgi:serine/threonine-protein kinase